MNKSLLSDSGFFASGALDFLDEMRGPEFLKLYLAWFLLVWVVV